MPELPDYYIAEQLRNNQLQDTPEEVNKIQHILDEVPELHSGGLLHSLLVSLKKSKDNYFPDNPFNKVKGQYTFYLDTSKSGSEKTEYIHKKIIDHLFETTGKLFVFKPGDNSKIYSLDDDKHSFKVSRLLKDSPTEIQKLLTQYPTSKKSKIDIKITTDPLDIVKKSTHQSWESCETVGGSYCQGIFSDIENNNAIAYIHIDDSIQPSGRFMLRWCNTPEKKADIGIEPIMYPRKSYSMEIYELLKGIIGSKGYGSYDDCTTPYKYKGYSDYIGGSGVITYHSGPTDTVLIQYASMSDISRNLALALAEHTVPTEVRRALAENDSVCYIEDAVNKLSKDIDRDTKINLIRTCSNVMSEEDKELGLGMFPGVITKSTITETAIDNLLNDDEDIRLELAQSIKNVPESTLERIANDNDYFVRVGLARNKIINCCDNIINKLADDESLMVKQELLSNAKRIPEHAAMSLALSDNRHQQLEHGLHLESAESIHSELASKEYIKDYPEVVRVLSDKQHRGTRQQLALNKAISCCNDVIEKFINNSPDVSIKLLDNKIIDKPTRKRVIENILQKTIDKSNWYGTETAHTINIKLAEQPEICDYPQIIDESLSYGMGSADAATLAENKHISCRPDIIRKLSSAPLDIKRKLSENPAIASTPDITESLFNNSNNPFIQENILMNPAIMEIDSIKRKLIERIDDYKDLTKHMKEDYFNLKELRDEKEGGYKPGFINLKTSEILYKLAKNPDLYKDKQLFDKVYENSPKDMISFNPHIFDRKDIVDNIIKSEKGTEELALLTSNKYMVNHIDIINKIRDTHPDTVDTGLYDTISYVIQSNRREGIQTNPEIKKLHKDLYFKLYPEQYTYEDANPFD